MDKKFWNRIAPFYNIVIRKDKRGYREIAELVKRRCNKPTIRPGYI